MTLQKSPMNNMPCSMQNLELHPLAHIVAVQKLIQEICSVYKAYRYGSQIHLKHFLCIAGGSPSKNQGAEKAV